MLLHRSMDLPRSRMAREEEMAQAVITALAWYEDTLQRLPSTMYYAGVGGAGVAAQSSWAALVQPAPQLVDLASTDASALTSIPPGVTRGRSGGIGDLNEDCRQSREPTLHRAAADLQPAAHLDRDPCPGGRGAVVSLPQRMEQAQSAQADVARVENRVRALEQQQQDYQVHDAAAEGRGRSWSSRNS